MALRRLPVGRIAAVAALLVGVVVLARGVHGPRWRALRPGIEFAMMTGDPYCQRGSSQIAMLRIDPAHARIRVHHFSLAPEHRPLDAVEWRRSTGADAVFNAGQFLPDWTYMGVLVCDGEIVSRRVHPTFKAALVAGPLDGGSGARVLDLEREPIDPGQLRWRDVAQSFMLFDRSGRIRVRTSDRVANRTAVGEDKHGRLVVLVTEGAYTLDGLAHLILKSPLEIALALSMDGGSEAQLCVDAGGLRYTCMGGLTGGGGSRGAADHIPLPAVVSVSAR
jgi:Phosphodiester glycosidase